MSKLVQIALGIFTSIGGFLEVGAIATTAQAGAAFGFQLIWAVLLGTVCVIFLVEMSGRLAAVSRHTIKDALRERFGPRIYMVTLVSDVLINLMVLAAEIGGMSLALQLVTGISFRWWALPVGVLTWVLLWKGSFGLIEYGVSLLGMVEELLGRVVRSAAGRPIAVIQDLRARPEGDEYLIREVILGELGLRAKLIRMLQQIPTFQLLGLGGRYRTRAIPWHWLDLSDPHHPRFHSSAKAEEP